MNSRTATAKEAERSAEALLKTIRIPPRPRLLLEVQQLLAQHDPDPAALAQLVAQDVAMAAAVLKMANAAAFGLRLQAHSVPHAVQLLGLHSCSLLLMGVMARQAVVSRHMQMETFWEHSTRRALSMAYLARTLRTGPPELAHTFGLFCDIGVPILHERFPDYAQTYQAACTAEGGRLTDLEEARHTTHHAAIGALMARTWGLPESVSLGILLHHDFAVLADAATAEDVRTFVALSVLADHAHDRYAGREATPDWHRGGQAALDFLGLSTDELEERVEEVHALY